MIEFDWDEGKNKANRKMHGIWFEEPQHRKVESVIRIISARKATKKERVSYQKLIDLYLLDCVKNKKKLSMKWTA